MESEYIYYIKGAYKYQLTRDLVIQTDIETESSIVTRYVNLSGGILTVKAGFAFDGPSGLTIDTPSFMRGAGAHDGIYWLIRNGYLDPKWREEADKVLRRLCYEDDMLKCRVKYVYDAVRIGAGYAVDPQNKKKEQCAPKKKRELKEEAAF